MKTEILSNLGNARQLEKLYRADKHAFKRVFNTLYPEIEDNPLIEYWNERLNFPDDGIFWGTRGDLVFVLAASCLTGIFVKLPALLSLDEEFFYSRNIGFIVFPLLTAYFAWKNKISPRKSMAIAVVLLVCLVFINCFPGNNESDTLLLSSIHLPILLWLILAFAFIGGTDSSGVKRSGFLAYNGDLLVMTGLIIIVGGFLSGITIGLFSLIGLNIEKFYVENIGLVGLAATPIVATFLIQTNPQLVSKVSPVIARIFSPLVLATLVTYLAAIIYSGKDPYNDREFLLIFNGLLIGVMAIIFFSVAEMSKSEKSRVGMWILALLAIVTIAVNGVALSAILFRISEWGLTPNRTAVLGANVLILANLLSVTVQLFKVLSNRADISRVGKAIAFYLPVYGIWAVIVTFIFPLLFGFN
ncbi:hypothetical protein ACFOET_16580 [Parapedobacter deserti]|uniref:DUF4153 domain-containing protein n=1 Tax=Parapedobacter deserti TaxID=1912957 RepID=A0ABV7JQU9_9SPHI